MISNSSAPGKELSAAYEKLVDVSTESPDYASPSEKGDGSEAVLDDFEVCICCIFA
jgi:hypothetical protein